MRVWIVQRYGQVAAVRESRRSAMEEVPVFTSTPQTIRLQDPFSTGVDLPGAYPHFHHPIFLQRPGPEACGSGLLMEKWPGTSSASRLTPSLCTSRVDGARVSGSSGRR